MAPRFSSKSNNTKTWFLMLGIAAVVALDFGFTVLVGSENTPSLALDTPVARPRVTAATRLSPEPVKPETSQDTPISEPPAKQVMASRPRLNSPRHEISTSAPRQTIAMIQRQSRSATQRRQGQFAPVTIRYTASPPIGFRPYFVTTSDNISYASADVGRPRHDSLASKFSPLVKKPWHLVKSLVSKLK